MQTPAPSLSAVAAANLRRFRGVRHMSVRDLSRRLGELGHPLLPSGITGLEHEDEKKRRRMNVDDLAALALALETSPGDLLAPHEKGEVAVTPNVTTDAGDVARWMSGRAPLDLPDDTAIGLERREAAFYELAQPWVQHRERSGKHPLFMPLMSLEDAVRAVIDPEITVKDPSGTAAWMRHNVNRLKTYVDLLADEVDLLADEAETKTKTKKPRG